MSRWEDPVYSRNIWPGIIQPGLTQRKAGCAYTAISRQAEYNLRAIYRGTTPRVEFPQGALFDHGRWQRDVRFAIHNPRVPSPKMLLTWAIHSGIPVTEGGMQHRISTWERCYSAYRHNDIRRLDHYVARNPLIAVLPVCCDYPKRGQHTYVGEGAGNNRTHAVVIVGTIYDRLAERSYYLYQDSHGHPGQFGNSLNCVEKNLIYEAYMTQSVPSDLFTIGGRHVVHWHEVINEGIVQRGARDPSVPEAWTQAHNPAPDDWDDIDDIANLDDEDEDEDDIRSL